ncbi:MAG: UDP-3-O-acyl-N-acetylglucosamine deacetylase, partial [Pseudomonadota bacterium]|nr:UDP-3-O-acyl-N-acetylglucosamine deacetylase [Pseudomonadota bacterium]
MNIRPQKQRTLKHAVEITGIALHSGRFIHAVINPAPTNYGIVFERIDVSGCDR